jgi:DNA-binding MarR family transcriptional regulator
MQGKSSRIRDNEKSLESLLFAVPHAITRLFREQNRLHGRAVQAFGLSTEQAHLLLVLWTYGPMSMTELGREVALSSGTLSAAVDRMEAAGLVSRQPDPADRRALRIEPVQWPKERRKKLVDALLAVEGAMLAPLSDRERATLQTLLSRVLDHLEPTLLRRAKD